MAEDEHVRECDPGGTCPVCNEIEEEEPVEKSKQVWYLAHPVTGDPEGNVKNAIAWIRFLTLVAPERVYIAPWVAEVQAFFGQDVTPDFYDRVLADDMDVVRRCDGVVMVGGRISRGMDLEACAARESGGEVQDLSCLRSPPEGPGAACTAIREMLGLD